jgi:hypothetical protein
MKAIKCGVAVVLAFVAAALAGLFWGLLALLLSHYVGGLEAGKAFAVGHWTCCVAMVLFVNVLVGDVSDYYLGRD